jgi:hypothetical protein
MAVSFLALGTLTEISQKTRRLLAILSKFGYLLKKAGERPEGFFESLVEPLKPSGRCSLSPKN